MHRRDCLKYLAATTLGAGIARDGLPSSAAEPPRLTPPDEIESRVRKARPLLGGPIPSDLKKRLGATHYGGKYCLTEKPFLLEGCEALAKLGMGVAKLWFENQLPGYGFHSDWKLSRSARLVEVAQHAYFLQAFAMPFSAFVLEIGRVTATKRSFPDPESDYAEDEKQFFELTDHLLRTYRQREVTFVLQHWEGDWLLRGAGKNWTPGGPPEAKDRCEGLARWLAARQRGVSRARAAAGATQCRVYHAAEVNRVWDSQRGIPTVVSHVLPNVAVDLVSWSCYDGLGSVVKTWQGLELIRHYARPGPAFGKPVVYIGEVGKPERGQSETSIVDFWDRTMGVFLAQELPYILQWELYCNEPVDKTKRGDRAVFKADQIRGFWLIRPDGSLSFGGKYFQALLDHAGGKFPETRGNG